MMKPVSKAELTLIDKAMSRQTCNILLVVITGKWDVNFLLVSHDSMLFESFVLSSLF